MNMADVRKTAEQAVSTADSALADIDKKMNVKDPVCSGSFSMNRQDNEFYGFGINSFTAGFACIAEGHNSFAIGSNTIASGYTSYAEGGHTVAGDDYQHVQGKFNIPTGWNSNIAHIVGNGTNGAPSNCHTLDWDGNAWYSGSVECTHIILKSSTEGSTKRFKVAVDDSGTLTATEI